nr:hypothetical protein [Tanacetum cinerariifolium]
MLREFGLGDGDKILFTYFRIPGTFSYPYPMKSFDNILRDCLCRLTFEAQTFLEPILYLVGLANSWKDALNVHSILIDGEGMALLYSHVNQPVNVGSPLVDHLTIAVDDDQALEEEATVMRPIFKKKKNEGSRWMSARGNVPPLLTSAPKDVKEAHATHNMLSGLHYPLLQDEMAFLSFYELVNVYDVLDGCSGERVVE